MLAAAGSGQRLGAGGPKALVELGGRPMLAWSLEALARAASVGEVVVAAPPGDEGRVHEAGERVAAAHSCPVRVVTGGESRGESVALALEAASEEAEFVVVHDAARPLVTPADIDALVATLATSPDADAVIAAAPITDTVKRALEPRADDVSAVVTVEGTESRAHLWAAQTPQVFRAKILRGAVREAAPQRLRSATDEASLVEQAGGTVLMRRVSGPNPKVTTPDDLRLAEHFLRTAAGS